ncbi:hypothetical protein, partial [Streptomyces sp. NPDC048425]|uniref:hypothetical protein n=1 Tax=Streptomyces sp. NPDC048425 TaxID=3365548 RepID=UPI00371B5E1B
MVSSYSVTGSAISTVTGRALANVTHKRHLEVAGERAAFDRATRLYFQLLGNVTAAGDQQAESVCGIGPVLHRQQDRLPTLKDVGVVDAVEARGPTDQMPLLRCVRSRDTEGEGHEAAPSQIVDQFVGAQ